MDKINSWLAARARNVPRVSYPPELPIAVRADEIVAALRSPRQRVVIISGETGCGKSTQIPKMCLEAGRGINGRIGVTQPRRLAAVTIAYRIVENHEGKIFVDSTLGRGSTFHVLLPM